MGSRRNDKRIKRNRNFGLIFICTITFFIGFYVLDEMSAMEKPPINNTLLIIIGCVMMAVSALIVGVRLKKQFFPKKKHRSRHIYLKDQQKDQKTD